MSTTIGFEAFLNSIGGINAPAETRPKRTAAERDTAAVIAAIDALNLHEHIHANITADEHVMEIVIGYVLTINVNLIKTTVHEGTRRRTTRSYKAYEYTAYFDLRTLGTADATTRLERGTTTNLAESVVELITDSLPLIKRLHSIY